MELSSVVNHLSDKKSELSVSLESNTVSFTYSSWFFPRLCSLLFIALLSYWVATEQNGFSMSMPSVLTPVFNTNADGYLGYHALGLSIWAVICNQETIMAYAIPLCCRHSYFSRKWTHIVAQVIGVLSGIGGMLSIYWYKNSSVSFPVNGKEVSFMNDTYYIPYSPHACLGIVFMGAWIVQCVGRFFPSYMTLPRHRFLGRLMYSTGLVCCALGIQQQQTKQITFQQLAFNTTSTKVSGWWLSQPSLGVLLLGVTGVLTFYYGLL